MPFSSIIRTHPSKWMDEARGLLLDRIILPATQLSSIIATAQKRTHPSDSTTVPGNELEQAREVAHAFYAIYPKFDVEWPSTLSYNTRAIWGEFTGLGLLGKPIVNQTASDHDIIAYQLGLVIREMAIEALSLFLPPKSLEQKLDLQPIFLLRQNELHDFLACAAYYFYHLNEMQLQKLIVSGQTELMLSKKEGLLSSMGILTSRDRLNQTD